MARQPATRLSRYVGQLIVVIGLTSAGLGMTGNTEGMSVDWGEIVKWAQTFGLGITVLMGFLLVFLRNIVMLVSVHKEIVEELKRQYEDGRKELVSRAERAETALEVRRQIGEHGVMSMEILTQVVRDVLATQGKTKAP